MAKIQGFKRIVQEDFPEENRTLVGKIGEVFNIFQEQVYYAFNKNIDENNLNIQTISFKVLLNADGTPKTRLTLKYNLKTQPKGFQILRVTNLTDNTFPVNSPFITFRQSAENIIIEHITGLSPNKEYELYCYIWG